MRPKSEEKKKKRPRPREKEGRRPEPSRTQKDERKWRIFYPERRLAVLTRRKYIEEEIEEDKR